MFADPPKVAPPATSNDRRRDPLKREAFDQRDRSKRVGTTSKETKSACKMDHADSTFGRFI